MIVETIPIHPQVFADSVFTEALPRLDAETTFLKKIVDLNLENLALTAGNGSHASIFDVGVLQNCLEDDGLEV